MVDKAPSIIEEDETNENGEYDYDRIDFDADPRANTSLVINQSELIPQTTLTTM